MDSYDHQTITHPIASNVSTTLPMSAEKQPTGFGSPLRRIRPAKDSYPTFLFIRRFWFVHQRNGLRSSVIPSAFLTRLLAMVSPKMVFHEGRRYLKNFMRGVRGGISGRNTFEITGTLEHIA